MKAASSGGFALQVCMSLVRACQFFAAAVSLLVTV